MLETFSSVCSIMISTVICLAGLYKLAELTVIRWRFRGLTGTSWNRVRALVRTRDGETCQYCGKRDTAGEVDHVLPLSRGGSDILENLVWACQECNRQKKDKTPREFIKTMRGNPDEVPVDDVDPGQVEVMDDPKVITDFYNALDNALRDKIPEEIDKFLGMPNE